jgi:hypothetical protein
VPKPVRFLAFKTEWFAKAARKAGIADAELCKAVMQVIAGQADDLGGGVYKKRLASNRHRSIILARGGEYWVYEYLFAKQDRANIEDKELRSFRSLAKAYAALTAEMVAKLIEGGEWIEICAGMNLGELE